MNVIITHLLFVAITYGKVSLWLWKNLENSGNFFLLLFGHPVIDNECGAKLHKYRVHMHIINTCSVCDIVTVFAVLVVHELFHV